MKTSEFIKNIPLSTGCEIANFDECGLIAINKKAGRATHPNANPSPNAKPQMVRARYNFREEYYSWENPDGQKQRLFLVNRLDSPTSGVVLAADNEETANLAKAAFKSKTVEKTYMAICIGKIVRGGTWVDRLRPRNKGGFVRSNFDPNGLIAKTDYQYVRSDVNGLNVSLIQLNPITGLTHQLRVQCAMHDVPILGDATYGKFLYNKQFRAVSKINRLFLHCLKTGIEIETGGKTVRFEAEAPLPESYAKVLDYNNEISKKLKP